SNGQERLGPIWRQVGVERVDEQRQQTVVPHDERELDHSLTDELLERGLKRPAAHATGTEEFSAVVHHGRLVGSESRKLFALAQSVDDLTADARLARGARMRVPDVLAIELP